MHASPTILPYISFGSTMTSSAINCSSLGLCFLLVLLHGSLAQLPYRSSRLTGPSDCQIRKITAREPDRRLVSEAGSSELWDSGDELECAGVQVARLTIHPRGLLLPYYASTPELLYVVRGEGVQGSVLPGCDETFESTSEGGGSEEFIDQHQRVYRYEEGDVLALPGGAVHWSYNDGDTSVVLVALRDTSNVANQLDRNFKKFLLAGNPQSQVQHGSYDSPGQKQQPGWPTIRPGRQQQGRPSSEQEQPWRGERPDQQQQSRRPTWERQEQQGFNMFTGFEDHILQEVFYVGNEIVRQLKGLNDNRGLIVLAENFQVLTPKTQEQEQTRGTSGNGNGNGNGIEQTICSAQLSANIANPVFADVYNPRGGRISSLNSLKLPILKSLQLSAEKGVLYKNGMVAPHYNLNAHSIIYITSGSSRLQIVRNDGSAVFDGVVEEGQLIVVPQDFALIKKAGEQGCEWVAFKTNDNAMTTQLAGRFSYIHALPEGVLVNSYNISPEEAKNLKYNRKEGVVLSPRSAGSTSLVKNVVLDALFG